MWSGWFAGGLVVAGGVECEVAEDFAGGGVDDADVEVIDEGDDVGSAVLFADSNVVESAVVAGVDGTSIVEVGETRRQAVELAIAAFRRRSSGTG